MMAKGTYAAIMLATKDLDGIFARLEANGAEIMQEPTEQDWGARGCACRQPDPHPGAALSRPAVAAMTVAATALTKEN